MPLDDLLQQVPVTPAVLNGGEPGIGQLSAARATGKGELAAGTARPFENQRPPATGNRVTAADQQLQRLQTDLR
jgi:hypothetical protein